MFLILIVQYYKKFTCEDNKGVASLPTWIILWIIWDDTHIHTISATEFQ